jgi:hypothetical protein
LELLKWTILDRVGGLLELASMLAAGQDVPGAPEEVRIQSGMIDMVKQNSHCHLFCFIFRKWTHWKLHLSINRVSLLVELQEALINSSLKYHSTPSNGLLVRSEILFCFVLNDLQSLKMTVRPYAADTLE